MPGARRFSLVPAHRELPKDLGRRSALGTSLAPIGDETVLKPTLARWANRVGAVDLLLQAPGWLGPSWLPALGYHRIHLDAESQPFDRGVIDATPSQLHAQLAILCHHFTPVGVDDLLDHVQDGRPLPRRPILITFDDGYRECVTEALPVLLAHGAKASFFVSTSYLTQRRVFWWDRISYLVRTSREQRLQLDYPTRITLDLGIGAEPSVRRLLGLVKSSYDLDFERFLSELGERLDVPWNADIERRAADDLVMTWDDVRALRRAGMEVHSHTRSHRILQHVPVGELEDELAGSRDDLRRELGENVRAVSYPVGRPVSDFPAVLSAVRSAGYEVGFSSGVSWQSRKVHPLDMGRVLVDRGFDEDQFRALLAHPFFGTS